jgi:hypothetical protein
MKRTRMEVPHGGQCPVPVEYDDGEPETAIENLDALDEILAEANEDAELSESTETSDAGGGDAGTDEPEVHDESDGEREGSEDESEDGDGDVSTETD